MQKDGEITFWDGECLKIDSINKKVHCLPCIATKSDSSREFIVSYDYLVIAVGARVNTFNTPGVVENCHFLKVVLPVKIIYIFPFLQMQSCW